MIGHQIEQAPPSQRSLPDRIPQCKGIHPRLDAHREYLRQRDIHHVAGAIVDQLRNRARAARPDVARLIADIEQQAAVAVVNFFVAADPKREPAALRPRWTSAHWRIQHMRAPLAEGSMDSPREGGGTRRKIEIDGAGADPLDYSSGSERNRFSAGPGSEVNTTSARDAVSAGVSAHFAPASRSGRAASRRASFTTIA